MLALGILIMARHGYETISYISDFVPLINIFHLLVVGPLFIWIWYKEKIGYQEQSLLYILAGGVLFVHLIRLMERHKN
jgi:hypothetical protein